MSGNTASGGQLDELAAFALEYARHATADGGDTDIGAVFLFADDIEDRYLYTFADLTEARVHLSDPAHGYLRCALARRPAPDVLTVQAQEIGSSTSFLLTRRRVPDGPAAEVVRTEGAQALLPPSGPAATTPAPAPSSETTEVEAEAADPAELEELEYGIERAAHSGEGLEEADDRLQSWLGRADESDLAAAERWLRSRLPHVDVHDAADDALPDEARRGNRTPGRYAITFHEELRRPARSRLSPHGTGSPGRPTRSWGRRPPPPTGRPWHTRSAAYD